LLGLAPS
jgi:hypothetical protein